MPKEVYPTVTFIIPTLNAAHILPKCLSAIRSQLYPQKNIEIIIADGGSTDETKKIAKKFHAKVIPNPEVLHEQGKSRASKHATGKILFYTDADNILSRNDWISLMVAPYMKEKNIVGFLPQTIPAPDAPPLDRYLGYLFTDPFTWFTYGASANPQDYPKRYKPVKITSEYTLYRFTGPEYPLFGLSQGVGTANTFKRLEIAHADDLLAGIKLMNEGGIIAYIPKAGVYHYHVSGFGNFIRKYTWRIRNNLTNQVKGMGITQRTSFFSSMRKFRMMIFMPYGFSIIFPSIDAIRLAIRYQDLVMLYHVPTCFILATLIVKEWVISQTHKPAKLGTYG